jgi:hypothetical protein
MSSTRLCSIEACFAHDFLQLPASTAPFVRRPGGVGPDLHRSSTSGTTSSISATTFCRFQTSVALQPNIRTLRSNKAIGIMEQAAYQSRGGEFAELTGLGAGAAALESGRRASRSSSTTSSLDTTGGAGQYIRRYFDLLHGRTQGRVTYPPRIATGRSASSVMSSFVKRTAFFDEAEAVADNEADSSACRDGTACRCST